MMVIIYANIVNQHVKLVMLLPKMTVLIVRSVYIGYTTNNVLIYAQKVIMETT
jgi:general stress protein CsbA